MTEHVSKTELRRAAMATRDSLARTVGDVGDQLVVTFASRILLKPPMVVAGYAPTRSEVDPTPLLRFLEAAGWRCCLPVVVDNGDGLVFRGWTVGDALVPGTFGVSVPGEDAEELRPDVVLVPLLAYDGTGHRLGYGAGCYDRALARLRREGMVLAAGLAYAGQQVDALPAQDHDQLLDMVMTEQGVTEFGKAVS